MDLTRIKRFLQLKINWPDLARENQASAVGEEVSVFPLPDVVLLPGGLLPLHIFEEKYKKMAGEILDNNTYLAMSCLMAAGDGKLEPASICGVGKVTLLEEFADGRKNICVSGQKRARILSFTQQDPFLKASVEWVPDIPFADAYQEQRALKCLQDELVHWIFLNERVPDHFVQFVKAFQRAHHLADFVGSYFVADVSLKQKLLETAARGERFELVRNFLEQDARRLESELTSLPRSSFPKWVH